MEGSQRWKNHFLCSLCEGLLNTAVCIPCGHSFCDGCFVQHWDDKDQKFYSCPVCKKQFAQPPDVYTRSTIDECLQKMKKTTIHPAEQSDVQDQEVTCDLCVGVKVKAVQSCLTCMVSCCEAHIQLHRENEAFRMHRLDRPTTNLQEMVCVDHKKPLDLFCKSDEKFICSECLVTKHIGHKMEVAGRQSFTPIKASKTAAQEGTDAQLRIMLLGKSGVGKSAAGNTILGKEKFTADSNGDSATTDCEIQDAKIDRCHVVVTDTPGFFNTRLTMGEVISKIRECIHTSSGPHVFLVVVEIGNFNCDDQQMVEIIKNMLGEKVTKHMMVLFTHGENLRDKNIKQFVKSANKDLKNLLQMCNYRYHVFNDTTIRYPLALELFRKIDQMMVEIGGRCYKDERKQEKKVKKEPPQEKMMLCAPNRPNKSDGEEQDKEPESERDDDINISKHQRKNSMDDSQPNMSMKNDFQLD